MITEYKNPINYFLNMDKGFVHLNQHIGKKLNISHIGLNAYHVQKNLKYLDRVFVNLAFMKIQLQEIEVMRPELSKAHLNQADRDLEYEKKSNYSPILFILH